MNSLFQMPIELDDDLKNLIRSSFVHAVSEIGEEELLYIEKKIFLKLESVKHNDVKWVSDLISICETFFTLLSKFRNNEINISDKSCKSIGAALFYFINPYDIIPDSTLGSGYADDYYVTILCFESMNSDEQDILSGIFRSK